MIGSRGFGDSQPLMRRFQDSEKFWIVQMVENVPKLLPDIQEQVFQFLALNCRVRQLRKLFI